MGGHVQWFVVHSYIHDTKSYVVRTLLLLFSCQVYADTTRCSESSRGTVSSGPQNLDVRLLLYRGCHNVETIFSSAAKQLTCGVSIVLLGSSSAESNLGITCQISLL